MAVCSLRGQGAAMQNPGHHPQPASCLPLCCSVPGQPPCALLFLCTGSGLGTPAPPPHACGCRSQLSPRLCPGWLAPPCPRLAAQLTSYFPVQGPRPRSPHPAARSPAPVCLWVGLSVGQPHPCVVTCRGWAHSLRLRVLKFGLRTLSHT